jgi:hypothetical protein
MNYRSIDPAVPSGLDDIEGNEIESGDLILMVNFDVTGSGDWDQDAWADDGVGIWRANEDDWDLIYTFGGRGGNSLPLGTPIFVYARDGDHGRSAWEVTGLHLAHQIGGGNQSGSTQSTAALCAATGNVSSLSGLAGVDGVTPVDGDVILVWQQTTGSENGLYAAASGAWEKIADFEIASPIMVGVAKGNVYGQTAFVVTADTTVKLIDPPMAYMVRVASTANISSLSGSATIDGVSPSTGDLILLKDQSTASQNGIYRYNSSGAWDYWVGFFISFPLVITVANGTLNGQRSYVVTADNTVTDTRPVPDVIPCKAATTADKTLSGLSAIDGYTPSANDYILVWQQSTASQNGIYKAASGSWTKVYSFGTDLVAGKLAAIINGTTYAQAAFMVTGANAAALMAGRYQ